MALGYVGLVNLNRVACTIMSGVNGDAADRGGQAASEKAVSPVRGLRDLRGRRRVHDLARFICATTPGGTLSFRRRGTHRDLAAARA